MIDIEPLVASVEAFSSAGAQDDRAKLLAEIRVQLETLGASDEKSRAELKVLYESPSKGRAAVAEATRAMQSRKEESVAAEALRLRLLSLQRYLIDTSWRDDPEAHALVQQAVNIVTGYFAGYLDLRDQLIRMDAKQQVAATAVLRARPIKGEVDHEALSREFIARFPKIRAALAE
jgi:hypothetical protein